MIGNELDKDYYLPGMRVEVGIPMSDSKEFRDWGVVREIDDELISLQLSRDVLPAGLRLRVGQKVSIRSERDFKIRLTNAFILSRGYDQELLLRLNREIPEDELREFYRIDSFIQVKLHNLDEQNPANVKTLWEERKEQRMKEERLRDLQRQAAEQEKLLSEETIRLQRLYSSVLEDGNDEDSEEDKEDECELSWPDLVAAAVNISGGGIKIATDRKYDFDELVMLEMLVPSSRCIVDIVGRVVFSYQVEVDDYGRTWYYTGMQFVLIDESARFAIHNHISSLQLKRIRQLKGFDTRKPLTAMRDSGVHCCIPPHVHKDTGLRSVFSRKLIACLALVLFIVIAILPIYSFVAKYIQLHPGNQIAIAFVNSINKLPK